MLAFAFVLSCSVLGGTASARIEDETLPPQRSFAFVPGTNIGCTWYHHGSDRFAMCEEGAHGVIPLSYGVTLSDRSATLYQYSRNGRMRFPAGKQWSQPTVVNSVAPTRNTSPAPVQSHYTLPFGTAVFVPRTNIACTAIRGNGQRGASCSIKSQPTGSLGFVISSNQVVIFRFTAQKTPRAVGTWHQP